MTITKLFGPVANVHYKPNSITFGTHSSSCSYQTYKHHTSNKSKKTYTLVIYTFHKTI